MLQGGKPDKASAPSSLGPSPGELPTERRKETVGRQATPGRVGSGGLGGTGPYRCGARFSHPGRQLLAEHGGGGSPAQSLSLSSGQVMKLGNPAIARRLLERGADPDLKDRTGFAVLHDAARTGFLDTLQTLLDFQADVNVEDAQGNLPLHLAAQEGHLPVVAFLLDRTASHMEHRNRQGATAYDLALLYKRHAVASLLEDRSSGNRRSRAGPAAVASGD